MSFVDGFSDSQSSVSPTPNISAAVIVSTGSCRTTPKTAAQVKKAAAMPTPPNKATCRRFQRSSRGRATKPRRSATRRHNGTVTSDSASATANGAPIVVNMRRWRASYQLPVQPNKTALQQHVHRVEAVGPANLLSLFGSPGIVPDRHLDDPAARAEEVRGQLGLEVEPDRPQPDAVQHVS